MLAALWNFCTMSLDNAAWSSMFLLHMTSVAGLAVRLYVSSQMCLPHRELLVCWIKTVFGDAP